MEKSKTFLRAAGILMGATMLTTCVLGGTLAKYASEGRGIGSATIAKWAINVNDNPMSDTFEVNLFDNENLYEAGAGSRETKEDHAKAVAPGTAGSVAIVVENAGDTDANITVDLGANTAAAEPGEAKNLLDQLTFCDTLDGEYKALDQLVADDFSSTDLAAGASTTINLYWEWTFDENQNDTTLGTSEVLTSDGTDLVDITITANQKD